MLIGQRQYRKDLATYGGVVIRRCDLPGGCTEKLLPRSILIPMLDLEVGYHTKLPVWLRFGPDVGLLACPKMPAVGTDHALRPDRLPIYQRQLYNVGPYFETGDGMRE